MGIFKIPPAARVVSCKTAVEVVIDRELVIANFLIVVLYAYLFINDDYFSCDLFNLLLSFHDSDWPMNYYLIELWSSWIYDREILEWQLEHCRVIFQILLIRHLSMKVPL